VRAADIREAHQIRTVERIGQQAIVLAIQDTTDLNFSHHPKTKGLGPIGSQLFVQGLKVHSVLAVSEDGVPLGLLYQQIWARDVNDFGQAALRRQRRIGEKESKRWLTALVATEIGIAPEVMVVTIGDREADIYELFALERRLNSHLLIRSAQNRRVEDETVYLRHAIAQAPLAGTWIVEVPRHDNRPSRQALLSIRFTTIKVHPPRHHPQRSQLAPLTLQVIWAHEETPPTGTEPISWILLTTLAVDSFEDAIRCVRWYSYRWLIERYHFVLKSGCQVEALQLEAAERLERALATYGIVAWRLLWLTYEARVHPEQPCDTVLEPHEWQALECVSLQTSIPSRQPPSLQQAVRWIAQLGGFLARKQDGYPGVKVIWRGFRRLHDIAATWKLAHPDLLPMASSGTYG
jgi:hypothetical protein